ncbi:MAG: hypothetical protein D6721_02390 [Gammaproteobacteria bacterium]|nr:MAG: hypothetical protein D6721_02390 [Gammaproteobacteria bacterium]
MNRFAIALPLAILLALGTVPATADRLQVPAAPGVHDDLRGLTMDAVRQRLGPPRKVLPAVGDPPITRWIYDGLTVYFERDRAIHAVRHHPRPPRR